MKSDIGLSVKQLKHFR